MPLSLFSTPRPSCDSPPGQQPLAHAWPRVGKSLCAGLCLAVVALLGTAPVQAQPASKTTTNSLGMKMVRIPAGSFIMGACKPDTPNCSQPDPDARDDEGPLRTVTVKAFWLGQTEVTQGQFKKFIQATRRVDLITGDFIRANSVGDDAPIVHVSWNDAQDFIAWLNKTQGGGYRLPSEAEWEYACRAGGQHTYCGSNDVGSVAWYKDNSSGQLQAVATKQPNAWGLHDMSGNAGEWVQDWRHDNYLGAPTDGSAWTSGGEQKYRVLRSGFWGNLAKGTRAARRGYNSPGNNGSGVGFRVVRTEP